MPFTVNLQIGKKKRGNWRVPVSMEIDIQGEEVELRPLLKLDKSYPLPKPIYAGRDSSIIKRGGSYCKKVTKIHLKEELYLENPGKKSIPLLDKAECKGTPCNGCATYIGWLAGANPDYSEYLAVLEEIARDLVEAWEKGFAEAECSGEIKETFSFSPNGIGEIVEEVGCRRVIKIT